MGFLLCVFLAGLNSQKTKLVYCKDAMIGGDDDGDSGWKAESN